MNGLSRNSHLPSALRTAAALGLAASLSACADLRRSVSLPPVNPESPVAGIVALASRLSYDTPRLSDVPPLPKNVPDAGTVKVGVVSMVRCRGGLARFPITHPPLSGGTVQFAATERDAAQVNPADVPPPDSAARTDTFAEGLRAEAAPPAAIASGPPPTTDQSRPSAPAAPHPAPRAAAPHPAPRAAAPHPAPRASAPTRARRAPASAPLQAAANPASPSAPPQVTQTSGARPPLPGPLPDPLLARCT